ncbi:Protein ANTAGONIST OF LIKE HETEROCHROMATIN PROTEIN 1 [Formica fusca]
MEVDVALMCVVRTFLEPASYIYEDENASILQLIMEEDLLGITDTVSITRDCRRIPEAEDYVEHIIPSLSSTQFKSHFQMLPSTFEFILDEIGEKLTRSTDGNEMVPADKQLLLSLWRFATTDSYSAINQRFNVGKGTAVRSVRRVARALHELSSKYIVWPTEDKIQDIVYGFFSASGFPDTIGAIGGTHINIPSSKNNSETYVNQKNHYSIQLQAVCDHTKLFTHVYVGNVHSDHDTCTSRLSDLQEYISDSNKFPNNTHLIGNAVYGLHQHLMVPYSDNENLTKQQRNYNLCHSSGKMMIKRAFALLKGRWKSLLHVLAISRMDFTYDHILACCVLHNICLLKKDEFQLHGQMTVLDVEETELQEEKIEYNDKNIAEAKRNNICAKLHMKNV